MSIESNNLIARIGLHQLGAVDGLTLGEFTKQYIVDLKDFLSSFVGSLSDIVRSFVFLFSGGIAIILIFLSALW